ncbi:MAG: NYN domain-containing protein [Gemmobacter sp.]
MVAPLVLFVMSLVGLGVALMLPGMADLVLLAGPSTVAAAILLLRAPQRKRTAESEVPHYILIDGSNVMHWQGGTPRVEAVRAVVTHLAARGFTPGVVFDANAGHLLAGRYRHDRAMARMLGLPEDRVLVVPKGSAADAFLLEAARDLGARIVTNDRYRDWAEAHPEVRVPGFLIGGGFRDGALWLALEDADAQARVPLRA